MGLSFSLTFNSFYYFSYIFEPKYNYSQCVGLTKVWFEYKMKSLFNNKPPEKEGTKILLVVSIKCTIQLL